MVKVSLLLAPGKGLPTRFLVIRNEPVPRRLAVATCQPAGALAATTAAGMQTTKVNRASAVNRLALLPSSKPLAIVRHVDDESSGACRAYGVLAPVAVGATVNVAPWQESFA